MRTVAAAGCTLEPLVAAHAPEMFAVLSDPAIYEFENEPPASLEWLAARYARLEARGPADGSQLWLNWVIRMPTGPLVGTVQATVLASGTSLIAYELNSRHWRQGIGSAAVRAMLDELRCAYGVHTFVAVLEAKNHRSMALLRKLEFEPADVQQAMRFRDAPDEIVMVLQAGQNR